MLYFLVILAFGDLFIDFIKYMLTEKLLRENVVFRRLVRLFCRYRAKTTLKRIRPYLKKEEKLLDIGSGTCEICYELKKKGFRVLPLDVENFSIV